jgi:hypothetical protein
LPDLFLKFRLRELTQVEAPETWQARCNPVLEVDNIDQDEKAMIYPLCPQCSTKYVKRVRRESLKERLLSVFYVYPFRCQLCGHRFSFYQPGVKYVRVQEDCRIYERFSVNFPATFTSGELEGEGSVADISMAGCTIEPNAKLKRD